MTSGDIVFWLPKKYEKLIWSLPEPSSKQTYRKGFLLSYTFQFMPQGKREWQRVASFKVQLKNRFPELIFKDPELIDDIDGKIYKISKLGKYFTDSIKFPPAFYEGENIQVLTRHAKRLHYYGMLYFEHLMYVSHRLAEMDDGGTERRSRKEGMRQIMKRAESAYLFALEHLDDWKVKLSDEDRHTALSQAALKSAQVKREKSKPKRDSAKMMREEGHKLASIASEIDVSLSTVKRWLKKD